MNGVSIISFDILTLAFTRGIMQTVLGGLLLYLGTRQHNDGAASWWAFGFIANGLSLFAFAIDVPEAWNLSRNIFNHLALAASGVFFLIGFWNFGQQSTKPWLLLLLMTFPLISIISWELLWPNARYRVLCTATGQVLYFIALLQALSTPPRAELAKIYQRLRWVVFIYLLVFIWSYASIVELLPTSARQSLDYHKSIFSLSSLLFMLTLAVGCLALKFALLAARNSDLAMQDWLTGLLNQRGFYHAIDNNNPDAADFNNGTSLLAIDIDHFKKINDADGHAAGDQVLQYFAKLLKNYDNGQRLMARMGGEEFLILLFNTPQSEALTLAENIRQKIEQSTVKLANQKVINFTISIGVHTISDNENTELALAQADDALYKAKRNGRNQVAFD